jgi:hypothetical protein
MYWMNKTYTWGEIDLEERPVDRNDPEAAATAVALAFPHELSDNAWRMLNYLDGTAFLFAYKGQLVVTDESLDLTECGDGTPESPFGGPRWVGDSFQQLEAWLEHEFWGWLEYEDAPFTTETTVERWDY